MKKLLMILGIVLLAGSAFWYINNKPDPAIAEMPKVNVTLNNVTFSLYAPTDTEGLQKGLSIFDKLEPNEGMIFRGLPVGQQAFWMQDMKFDIDIIWVNKDNEVIHIVNDASKDSFPTQFKNPADRPSAYVIELNAGMAEKHSIYPGTQVTIQQ